MMLAPLPDDFASTRESLRALACFVLAPARKARTGRIGLRPAGEGFGTPPFDDGSRLVVRGAELAFEPGGSVPITTLRAAAAFVGIALSPDPGVGHDLPPYEPDRTLAVGGEASLALGGWYSLGAQVLEQLREARPDGVITEAQLWPEHFDLAVTVTLDDGVSANVGFSPGDGFHAAPYVYVGPHVTDGLDGAFWNAPFGAVLSYERSGLADDPPAAGLAFVLEGIGLLAAAPPAGE
jgi:hypothetical protein